MWEESSTPNRAGKAIEAVLLSLPQIVLITPRNLSTYQSPVNDKFSTIDLTFVGADIPITTYPTKGNYLGSDHFPISTSIKVSPEKTLSPPKWVFKNQEWHNWNKFIHSKFNEVQFLDIKDPQKLSDVFSETLIAASHNFFKFIDGSNDKTVTQKNKKWFSSLCKQAIAVEHRARRNYLNRKGTLEEWKLAQAIKKRTILKAKRTYVDNIVDSIEFNNSKSKQTWGDLNNMFFSKNTRSNKQIPPIVVENSTHVTIQAKANAIAKNFANYSDSQIYNEQWDLQISEATASTQFCPLNGPLTSDELKSVLAKLKLTTMGPDLIHNTMLTHLSIENQFYLSHMLNSSLTSQYVPEIWKQATIIPILKPGKSPSATSSYRPISLTSCVSKVMEKILTNRLQWFLTHKNILSNNQSGFRQSRSANDNLVFFDHTIKTAFSQNSNAYALFLDISKAYDTTSTQGLLVKLSKIGLTGNLLGWIKNFLTNRSFRVRIGNVTSHKFLLTTGVPQGSVISPILFNIMMHDFPMKQDQGQTLLFADDISFITTEYTSDRALITLQSFLNSVAEWCETWKFKMSPDKCALMVFTKKKITDYPLVQLDGVSIPTVTSFKFLGVTFDSKLNWKQHIDTIYNKCSRLLPLFYRLTRPTAAPSIKALLIIYKSLVRSIIDYGLIVYSTAAKTNIVKLDRIQNSFLRIILGSLPSTPIAQLQFETGIESIELRALWLSITYVIKLGSNSSNCNYTQLSKIVNNDFTFSTRSSPCLLQAILSIKKCNFSILENIPNASVPPPWQTNSVNILHLRITKQAATLYPEEAKALFLEFLSKLPKNAIHIFCDGSLFTKNNRTAAAYKIPRFKKNNSWSLQPGSSVLSAELSSIDGALTEVYHIANVDDEIYIFFRLTFFDSTS